MPLFPNVDMNGQHRPLTLATRLLTARTPNTRDVAASGVVSH
jgi:hypothetical protein